MNETLSFTTNSDITAARPPRKSRQTNSIITLSFVILLIVLFLLVYFTFVFIDYLIFPSVFEDFIAYQTIVTSSWTFAITTLVIFLFFHAIFLNSSKRKSFSKIEEIIYSIVDELPFDASLSSLMPTVVTNQTDNLPFVDSPIQEATELVATVKNKDNNTSESGPNMEFVTNEETGVQEIPSEFVSCAAWMDKALQQKGIKQKQASEFLSLMVFSRLIIIGEHDSQSDFTQVISGFFASEGAMIDATLPIDALDQQALMSRVLTSAISKPHLPHLIQLHHVDPLHLHKLLGAFAQYSRFPLQNQTLKLGEETFVLPNNLWFIVTLKPGTSVFSIPENLRIYLGLYKIKGEKVLEETTLSPSSIKHNFDWEKASRIFSPTYESKRLPEDLWKKVDQWVTLMNQISGYVLQNDVNLHLENYVLLGLTFGIDPLLILDQAFASSLLIHALAKAKPVAYQKENDLERFFESAFGRNTFKNSLAIVRHYLKEHSR
jgi:hypothetical protein